MHQHTVVHRLWRGLTQNEAILDSSESDWRLQPIETNVSPDQLQTLITQWADRQSGWSVVSIDVDPIIRLTRTTSILRFVDDVTIEMVDRDGRTQVNVTSKSRLGKGDLGQNRRNLAEFVEGIRKELDQTQRGG